jgi:ADP-ribosylglycohydrolase
VEVVADGARQDARLTHPNPVCVEASAVYAVTIAHAIATGGSPREAYDWALDWSRRNCTESAVVDAIEAAAERPPASYMRQQGWVLVALQNAFLQLLHATSLEQGVVATVQAGGDTDTNGAICGALLGAVHGRDAVPGQWQRMITSCRPMVGHDGVHQPRPAMFWPADAMVLAERLLMASAGEVAHETRRPLGRGMSPTHAPQ